MSWPKTKNNNKKLNVEELTSTAKNPFQLHLSNRFSCLFELSDPNVINNEISSSILDAANATLSSSSNNCSHWMSKITKEAIQNKHKIRKLNGPSSKEYKIAKAESKKLVKKDRMKQIEDDLTKISNLPPHKQYYAAIKRLKSKPKDISWGIKDQDGTVITNKEQILERWASFYETLYSDNFVDSVIDVSGDEPVPLILKSELEYAIKNLKNGKSPGLDNIYSEYIKAGGEHLTKALLHLFNCILTTNTVPDSFKQALIVVLYKKNSRLDCGNYRPISLLSHIYKLFVSIIASRVKNDLYSSFPDSQAAYQPGRGTIEQVIALEQIIEKSLEFNKPVFYCFHRFYKGL